VRIGGTIAACVLLLAACKPKDEIPVVARAYDRILTLEELMEVLPNDLSPEDSMLMAESYINLWLRENVLLSVAETNLPPEEKDFEKQLTKYRNSLIAYAFEQAVVNEKLDTNITEAQSLAYYEANPNDFLLKDYIIRAKFCVLPNDGPKLKKFRDIFFETKENNLQKIEETCVENNYPYFLDIDRWIYFEDLLEKVPMQIFDPVGFLKKNKGLEFEKDESVYFIYIYEYMLKDDLSPFSLEQDRIKSILLNQRKTELLNLVKTELYNLAVAKNKVEINDFR